MSKISSSAPSFTLTPLEYLSVQAYTTTAMEHVRMAAELGSIDLGDFLPHDPTTDWNTVSVSDISWPLSVLRTRSVYRACIHHRASPFWTRSLSRTHPSPRASLDRPCPLGPLLGPPSKFSPLSPPKCCWAYHSYRQQNPAPFTLAQPPRELPPKYRLMTVRETVNFLIRE